jgi:hypothetical protein
MNEKDRKKGGREQGERGKMAEKAMGKLSVGTIRELSTGKAFREMCTTGAKGFYRTILIRHI